MKKQSNQKSNHKKKILKVQKKCKNSRNRFKSFNQRILSLKKIKSFLEIKKKWTSVDSRKLAGLGKDVETFMMNKIMNIGITTQEETEEVERTEKEIKVKTHHICTDYLLTKLIW